jgi:hypothetical protein
MVTKEHTMSKCLFPAIALTLAMAASSFAAARPDTRTMSCEGAKAFVRSQGAVIMSTGRHTYDRIVASIGFCERGEEAVLKVAPTLDNPRCWVGSYCRDRLIEPLWRFPLGKS